MKNIQKIIEQNGGMERLKMDDGFYIRLENEGYMPLVIEYIGKGPRGLDCISVVHYYTQEGDYMRDPEMTFELEFPVEKKEWEFHPVTFRQDGSLPIDQELVFERDGHIMQRPEQLKSAKSFFTQWDTNIGNQRFLKCKNVVSIKSVA